ncbi:hypothetical protein P3X46_006891 [Hevea brasiliensis]|uniref:Glycosyltransferase n=1 Tax=Hevea brasiliensis TaxID=3981 RepID=A0ABQ9MVS4_HEVBR|nr:hypothetical protein P3X46_006891 [Hevea brasiliensis]
MADTMRSNHVAMFPWFAHGHFIPYLHLANKLAEKGCKVSFLLPKGAEPKLTQLNQHPNLIHFFPLMVPHVDGLPPGAETVSDVPFTLHYHLCTAMDQTQDQVKTILGTIKPKFVLYDFAYWVAYFGQELGFKSISYSVVCAASQALQEMMQTSAGYPSSTVVPRLDETAQAKVFSEEYGSGISFYERMTSSNKQSDAFAIRSCYEIEGPFIDYLSQQYDKPVLLKGPLLPEKPNQFQELLLGFELCGLPFLVALTPPNGCLTIEEAFPEEFQERIEGRGWASGCWVPQPQILEHPSVGCFVSHCGFGSMWESLLSKCQIVLVPHLGDQIVNTMLMVEELKVAIEVKKGENGWISKESLSNAIQSVMSSNSEVGTMVKSNHAKWNKIPPAETCKKRISIISSRIFLLFAMNRMTKSVI